MSPAKITASGFSSEAGKPCPHGENLFSFFRDPNQDGDASQVTPVSAPEQTGVVHTLTPRGNLMIPLLLASQSSIRLTLLRNAGVEVTAHPARIDEEAMRDALNDEHATPRDIADALAEAKAMKLAQRHPDALVLGCDQILALGPRLFSKPDSRDSARQQLRDLAGHTHQLLSAAVLYHQGEPIWRHVGVARLTMRTVSEAYLEDYLDRTWPEIGQSVGAYQLESEGIRLFSAIEGDYFTILGLPLLPLLSYLSLRGFIAS